jgi:hypothetical protein
MNIFMQRRLAICLHHQDDTVSEMKLVNAFESSCTHQPPQALLCLDFQNECGKPAAGLLKIQLLNHRMTTKIYS